VQRVLSAFAAEPLLGQLLLVYALQVEPLEFAEGVVAHHHLAEGRALAVAVLGLLRVILPVALPDSLPGHLLAPLPLPPLLLPLLDSARLQLLLQQLGGFVDQVV